MFDLYGYRLVGLLRQLRNLEVGIQNMLTTDPEAVAPRLDGEPMTLAGLTINVAASLAEELGLESTKNQITTLRRGSYLQLPALHFIDDIAQLTIRLRRRS